MSLAKRECYRALGDLTDLKVLELACGTGQDSIELIALGASHVTGLGISPVVIGAAKADLPAHLEDKMISHNIHMSTYDVVFAGYLLNYAPTAAALHAMFTNIA
ncbi:hypothetical protein B0H16DRAFT_1771519 [Mycena metata]|uniref:Methyltransferase domain-containing protein n=1 Tax=Mycena metata TaxID=1033252 RepID=A0AAD7JXR2_9AGAR|nr:hypothetical protein B0H16DRAFT_1771519 [Mycena metata]